MTTIRIATRSSPLAMWQARFVARELIRFAPTWKVRIVPLSSTGDQDQSTPLYGMGNIGVFAKEVHNAIRDGHADIGVHSCKDLPTVTPENISRPFILKRHDVRDALLGARSISELPPGAVVGTSSTRRMAQLAYLRPDLHFENIRGNVATRARKVHDGVVDATILAAAGLKRLGIQQSLSATPIPINAMIPAAAQGALAIDCRSDHSGLQRCLSRLEHRDTAKAVSIERTVLSGLRGGCSLPLGCLAERTADGWTIQACLGSSDQRTLIKSAHKGPSAPRSSGAPRFPIT